MISKVLFPKKIWIDLDNSPHVPFFVPIIEELERRGYPVLLTARDCFQVRDLIDLFYLPCSVVGRHYGKYKLAKVMGTCYRALQLTSFARKENPHLAVAHGSRSQMIAASLLGICSVDIGDYEFAKGWTMARPDWFMMPAAIPNSAIPLDEHRILKYPGIKEDVYVPRFKPDLSLRSSLGLGESDMVVTIRPPANEAHYHNPESDTLFHETINFLSTQSEVKIVLLPRTEKQTRSAKAVWPELFATRKIIVPEHVVDGLNLLWNSDLAISGGGTMNREAAALGVPVYSIFRGKIGAVDRHLAKVGRLVLLESTTDIYEKIVLSRRVRQSAPSSDHHDTLETIVKNIVAIAESKNPTCNGCAV